MDSLNYNSVETLPGFEARAAFTVNSAAVFREDTDIVPTIIDDTLAYIPWGGDSSPSGALLAKNQLPFNILSLIEKDVIDLRSLWTYVQRNRHWLGQASPCFAVKKQSTQISGNAPKIFPFGTRPRRPNYSHLPNSRTRKTLEATFSKLFAFS